MDTYIINSREDFHNYFPLLKETASINTTPNVYSIGFDTEFISKANYPDSFKNALSWVNQTPNNIASCVIQLASEKVCLIINLVKMKKPLPKKLIKVIISDSWIKFGVGIEMDLKNLSLNYNLGHCAGGIELKNMALLGGMNKPSMEHLFKIFIGGYIKKDISICDWSKNLTDDELTYAAKDAIISYKLGIILLKPSFDMIKKITIDENILNINIKLHTNSDNKHNQNKDVININYIGKLQEYAQKNKLDLPIYEELDSKIPNNFIIQCSFSDEKIYGNGSSKKKAKYLAAKCMYEKIKED